MPPWYPESFHLCLPIPGVLRTLGYSVLTPPASFYELSLQLLNSNAGMGKDGLEGQQPISPGQRPGCYMPCDDFALKEQKHFPPNDKAFSLSGCCLWCYPCSPGCYPGLVARCPFGAHSAEWEFVIKTSCFEPKKWGVLVTKGSFGRKNGNFWGFS